MTGVAFAMLVAKLGVALSFVVFSSISLSYYNGFSLKKNGDREEKNDNA